MTPEQNQKLMAGGKIAVGAYEVIGGALLGSGHGLTAKVVKPTIARTNLGTNEMKHGLKHIQEGLKEWKG